MTPAPAAVVWITGLPASGKSTLARLVAAHVRGAGLACAVLDGDEVRAALGRAATGRAEERDAFYEVLARLAALLAHQGVVAVVAATAPRRVHRERARAVAPRFLEVHVTTPLERCERRDPKGLYAGARAGRISGLPGVGEPFEPPAAPDVAADGGEDERAAARVALLLRPPLG